MALIWNVAALEAYFRSPNNGVGRDLARRAVAVESRWKELISGAYPPPSAPGTPPHLRSGRLRASINWSLGEDGISMFAVIGTNVVYAPYLEQGTGRMAARPAARKALEAAAL